MTVKCGSGMPAVKGLAAVLAIAAQAAVGDARHILADAGSSGGLAVHARGLRANLGAWLEENGVDMDAADDEPPPPPAGGCSEKALEFIRLLNVYRAESNLDSVPASPSLCVVSDTHVKDLHDNNPDAGRRCGMHSWSDEGAWSSCCYPDTRSDIKPDEATKRCSWDKPRELTDYSGTAYENTLFDAGAMISATPESALEEWKKSESHHMLMINGGNWVDNDFNAVGAGFYGKYAVMWIGEVRDPAGVVG